MDTLSPEMLDLVLDHCEFASLKCLRSVNHELSYAATPRIFEHFYMGLFDDSVEKLVSLARSPLAERVKSFTFYSDIIPNWGKAAWEDNIGLSQSREDLSARSNITEVEARGSSVEETHGLPAGHTVPRLKHHFSRRQLDIGWQEFQRMRLQQWYWRQDRQGIVVQEHFAMLPNLVEAHSVQALRYQDKSSTWPVWKNLRERILVSPEDWACFHNHYDDGGKVRLAGCAPLCLLEAIALRSTRRVRSDKNPITKVRIHTFQHAHYQTLFHNTLQQCEESSTGLGKCLFQVVAPSRHLVVLDLRLHYTGTDRYNTVSEELINMLYTTTQLKRLDLDFSTNAFVLRGIRHPDSDLDLMPLFYHEPPDWQQLQHLGLSLNVRQETLLKFLCKIPGPLRSLELRDMRVHNVPALLEGLPKVLNLEHVYLEELWHQDLQVNVDPDDFVCTFKNGSDVAESYERGVKAYLLGQTDELPVMPTITIDHAFT